MNFRINAVLAIWLTGLIVLFWCLSLANTWDMGGEIRGATMAAFVIVVQYFFRKKPPRGTE